MVKWIAFWFVLGFATDGMGWRSATLACNLLTVCCVAVGIWRELVKFGHAILGR